MEDSEVRMETLEDEAPEVLHAREVAKSVIANLQAQLMLLREKAAEKHQRQWLNLSRKLLDMVPNAQAEELKLRQQQLRQQRQELEEKLKEKQEVHSLGVLSAPKVTETVQEPAAMAKAAEATVPPGGPASTEAGLPAAPAALPSPPAAVPSLRPKAKGPPPPKAKPKPKPKAQVVGQPTPPRTNGLVNINWKKKAAPKPDDFQLNDDFLREMAELSARPMSNVEISKESVFQGPADVPELSETQLQYWFGLRARPKRPTPCSSRATSVHSTSRDVSSGSNTPAGPGRSCPKAPAVFSQLRQRLLDDRTIRSAGIFLARFRMNHGRNTSASPKTLVEEICKAVLQCRIKKDADGLENLREAMDTYAQAGSPVSRMVEEQGLEALNNCDPEAEHRLLYQVSCIPGIYERLRCFRIQSSWDKDATKCKTDLQVLKGGLQVMMDRRDVLRRFFSQAMRLGNKLNQAAGGPLAPHGFRMSSLETLIQTKSPWRPKLSLLHVILGLLDASQVKRLAELEQLDPIRAHGLLGKTSGVQERCRELVMSLSKLRQLVAQVDRKCHDKAPDYQDTFHDYLDKFLESRRQEAVTLAEGCLDLYRGYKELAIFFGEPDAFYPPPVQSADGAEDMFLFFHRFVEVVLRVQKEIDSMRFREELQAADEGGPEAAAQVAEEVASANGMSLGFAKQRLLPEPITRADAVLMTPPGSPCRVRTVASPCRGRASDKAVSASARAVQRLKKMSAATPEADAQSDVSDWEPNSARRRSPGSPSATAPTLAPPAPPAASPPPTVSLGLPRRRLALPRERPQCSTPSSSASSPTWHEDYFQEEEGTSQASSARRGRSSSAGGTEEDQLERNELPAERDEPDANVEAVLSLPLPSTPTGRRSLSVPRGNDDAAPNGRRSEMRQRLSLMANRLESKALSQFGHDPADALHLGEPTSEVESANFASCCSDSTDSTWETARSCCPLPLGPEANASMNAELKRQVRKRSKPQEFNTPKNHQRMNLSPVGEPGETPYRTKSGSTKKGQSASAARSDLSQGSHRKFSPPTPPVARRLPFDRCAPTNRSKGK